MGYSAAIIYSLNTVDYSLYGHALFFSLDFSHSQQLLLIKFCISQIKIRELESSGCGEWRLVIVFSLTPDARHSGLEWTYERE